MKLTNKINEIIDRRIGRNTYAGKGCLDRIKQQKDFFQRLEAMLQIYQSFRMTVLRQIESQRGEYYVMSTEDPTFVDKVKDATPDMVLNSLTTSLYECNWLINRFSREVLNISVIGGAGAGKSTLLQSISGLVGDGIIPTADHTDCTGARSIIYNSTGEFRAEIVHYSDKEFIDLIQSYLNALGVAKTIGAVSDVANLDLEYVRNNMLSTSDADSKFEHLRKYVQHYKDYSVNIGKTIFLDDKTKIRYYVAQYDVNEKDTFGYLGVKEARIYTSFTFQDAGQIVLIDTVGLGDTKIGIKEKMMHTLANDTDAAILVNKRKDGRDAFIRDEDDKLHDSIKKSFGNRSLDKWLFYVVNDFPGVEGATAGFLHLLEEKKHRKAMSFCFAKVVKCNDQNSVEKDLLIPMLESMSANLATIDDELIQSANKIFEETYYEYFLLCEKIQKVISSNFKKNSNMGKVFDDEFKKLPLFEKLRERERIYNSCRDLECGEIQNEISVILKQIINNCPYNEDILKKLRGGTGAAHPNVVYSYFADDVRSKISDQFEVISNTTIGKLQENVKLDIIDVLYSLDGGKLVTIPLINGGDSNNFLEWLDNFIAEKLNDYPIMAEAFKYILDYRLNIEGLLEYKVSCSLDYLEPSSKKFCDIDFRGLSDEESANLIEQSFLNAMPAVAEEINNGISDLLLIPNNSFYARIRKFREKLSFSTDGREELRNFYRDNCTAVWKEEFANAINTQAALGDWSNYSAKVAEQCHKGLFNIQIL